VRAEAPKPEAIGTWSSIEPAALPDLATTVDWNPLLSGMDAVIHLAGIAHAGTDIPEATYDRINRRATEDLAQAASASGVRHFIFMSSIRAQSGPTAPGPLNETEPARPTDGYGRSKLAAEAAVGKSGVPFTILRPVVIYGPGVKANLESLTAFADSPWPLPFGRFRNLRSLLAMENLVSAIEFLLRSAPRDARLIYRRASSGGR
jgi:UDP-glucose 4-epimerase